MQDYVNAANCYEQLSQHHPDQEDYRVYYAQSLYAATLYEEAMKVVHILNYISLLLDDQY